MIQQQERQKIHTTIAIPYNLLKDSYKLSDNCLILDCDQNLMKVVNVNQHTRLAHSPCIDSNYRGASATGSCHFMKTLSALLACSEWNPSGTSDSCKKGPVMREHQMCHAIKAKSIKQTRAKGTRGSPFCPHELLVQRSLPAKVLSATNGIYSRHQETDPQLLKYWPDFGFVLAVCVSKCTFYKEMGKKFFGMTTHPLDVQHSFKPPDSMHWIG